MAKRSTRGGEAGGEGLPQPDKKRRAPAKKKSDGALAPPTPTAPLARDSAPDLSSAYSTPHDEHADDWSPAESIPMASEPSEEDIRMRAYQRFIARGADHGSDFDDWILAERELRKRD
jgi:hypothetical protein